MPTRPHRRSVRETHQNRRLRKGVAEAFKHGAITTTGVRDSVTIRSRIAFRDALLMQFSGRRR